MADKKVAKFNGINANPDNFVPRTTVLSVPPGIVPVESEDSVLSQPEPYRPAAIQNLPEWAGNDRICWTTT